jgi:hypothetical protein
MDIPILTKEIKLTNMSSATKEYIWQTAASRTRKQAKRHPPTATNTSLNDNNVVPLM